MNRGRPPVTRMRVINFMEQGGIFTQEFLSQKCNISPSHVRSILTGNPHIFERVTLSEEYETSSVFWKLRE